MTKNSNSYYYLSFVIPENCDITDDDNTVLILEDILKKAIIDNRKHYYIASNLDKKGPTLPSTRLFHRREKVPEALRQLNLEARPPYHGIVALKISTYHFRSRLKHRRTSHIDIDQIVLKNLYEIFIPKNNKLNNHRFKHAQHLSTKGFNCMKIDIPERLRNKNSAIVRQSTQEFIKMRFNKAC